MVINLPGLKAAKGQGVLGTHPKACLYWCLNTWVLQFGRFGVYGISFKMGVSASL